MHIYGAGGYSEIHICPNIRIHRRGTFKGTPYPLSLGGYVSISGPTGNRVKVGWGIGMELNLPFLHSPA